MRAATLILLDGYHEDLIKPVWDALSTDFSVLKVKTRSPGIALRSSIRLDKNGALSGYRQSPSGYPKGLFLQEPPMPQGQ